MCISISYLCKLLACLPLALEADRSVKNDSSCQIFLHCLETFAEDAVIAMMKMPGSYAILSMRENHRRSMVMVTASDT